MRKHRCAAVLSRLLICLRKLFPRGLTPTANTDFALWARVNRSCRVWLAPSSKQTWQLGRVAVLFLQELGEHALGIDLDERSRAGGQHFPCLVSDLSGSKMLPPVYADLPAFGDERLGERHRPDVIHLHGCGDCNDIAQLADLAHGFVEDSGDDAAMRVRRWPFKAIGQREVTDKAKTRLVEVKLQLQTAVVVGAATETHVAINVLLDLMSGNWFVRRHEIRMNHPAAETQVRGGFLVNGLSRHQLCYSFVSRGFVVVEYFEIGKCALQFPALQQMHGMRRSAAELLLLLGVCLVDEHPTGPERGRDLVKQTAFKVEENHD